MDANSIDPSADESVQRIQNSLGNINARAAAHKAAQGNPDVLHGLLEELSTSAHLLTESSETYQRMAEKDSVTAVLSEAAHDMIAIASTTASILRDKHGVSVDRHGYKVLKALPWHYEDIAEELKSLGEGDWSSKAVWEIERVLRESAPRTQPNGLRELIRVNTNRNSNEFANAVNTIAKETGMDVDDAVEMVETVLGVLRGAPYPPQHKGTPEDPEEAWVKYLTPEQREELFNRSTDK